MSWGTGEFYGETAYDSLFTTPAGHIGGDGLPGGVTFIAASGDSGAWSGVSYPAASPNVLSVGATTLYLGAGSSYAGEAGWTDSTGGFSALEPAPAYQLSAPASPSGLSYGLRTLPDVSAVGDPATGVSVYDTVRYCGQSGWFSVGGTSAAAPQWAGLIAVADQGLALAGIGSLANAQAALYSLPVVLVPRCDVRIQRLLRQERLRPGHGPGNSDRQPRGRRTARHARRLQCHGGLIFLCAQCFTHCQA